MSNKKYSISIQGEGTAEEITDSIWQLYWSIMNDTEDKKILNNTKATAGTSEYCYSDDGVLRTEVNEINE